MFTVEIEGNDGVGKTTIVKILKSMYNKLHFLDRGQLTNSTYSNLFLPKKNVLYIILDASVEKCQERIIKRGDSIDEPYHNIYDLNKYREIYLNLSRLYEIPVVSTEKDIKDCLTEISSIIEAFKYEN